MIVSCAHFSRSMLLASIVDCADCVACNTAGVQDRNTPVCCRPPCRVHETSKCLPAVMHCCMLLLLKKTVLCWKAWGQLCRHLHMLHTPGVSQLLLIVPIYVCAWHALHACHKE